MQFNDDSRPILDNCISCNHGSPSVGTLALHSLNICNPFHKCIPFLKCNPFTKDSAHMWNHFFQDGHNLASSCTGDGSVNLFNTFRSSIEEMKGKFLPMNRESQTLTGLGGPSCSPTHLSVTIWAATFSASIAVVVSNTRCSASLNGANTHLDMVLDEALLGLGPIPTPITKTFMVEIPSRTGFNAFNPLWDSFLRAGESPTVPSGRSKSSWIITSVLSPGRIRWW